MAKKKKAKVKNKVLAIVRTPMFKMRVEEDETKYNRKEKHKGKDDDDE